MSISPITPRPDLKHAADAVQGAIWVNSAILYEDMIGHLLTQPRVGIDTEFVRERTYYPAPGLVQLSDGQQVWLLDVVALDDHTLLKALLLSPTVTKILHSVGEDLEILSILTGHAPNALFDTQWAAALLGLPFQMRYEHLVKLVFDTELPGGQARSNWCHRPLAPSLLAYAAQDVIYLPALEQVLSEHLLTLNRRSWLEEDCLRMVTRREHNGPAILKVKGAGKLSRIAMAYAAQLADWRDQRAQARNLPRSFILKDDLLIELSLRSEKDGTTAAIRSLQSQLKSLAESCADLLTATNIEAFEIPIALMPMTPAERLRLKDWQARIGELAKIMNLDPSMLASKRELTRLLKQERPDWLYGWRGPLLEETLNLSIQ